MKRPTRLHAAMPVLLILVLPLTRAPIVGGAEPPDAIRGLLDEHADLLKKVEILRRANASRDAAAAFKAGDFRFLDTTGWGGVSGVPYWNRELQRQFGTHVVGTGFGMLLPPYEVHEAFLRLRQNYTRQYNHALWAKLAAAGKINPSPPKRLPDDPNALIERLAISDEPAVYEPIYTPGPYAPKTDFRVVAFDAADKLATMGTRAFPTLVQSLSDERQSAGFGNYLRHTVGIACFRTLQDQVEFYPYPGKYLPYEVQFLRFDKPLTSQWWRERSGRTLKELQIEACQFSVAAAKAHGLTDLLDAYTKRLRQLGVKQWNPQASPFAALANVRDLPSHPEDLVPCLAMRGETYVEKRIAAARADQAWLRLYDMGRTALPVLVGSVGDAEVGKSCLDLIRRQLEPTFLHRGFEQFYILNKSMLPGWWKEHAHRPLAELRGDLAEQLLRKVESATFKDPDEKQWLLDAVKQHLQSLRAKAPESQDNSRGEDPAHQ